MPITRPESLDRFELVSAYLDGEASPEERALVEYWLTTDPETQQLYRQLVHLHECCQALPAPPLGMSADEVVAGVITRLSRRARKRLVWSGVLVAASALVGGVLSGLLWRPPTPELAQYPDPQRVLRITLEQPPVVIPAQLRERAR
ncbi:MAG: zf-HC2 domain-containing protein [Gloeomargarita sp. SKYBB_i_bin120]|nr:zf-HC2 domain-containing protein [Gloeomargarita sp. SKYG98]MCS7291402.1 zf-HC2 domain-containing protein [Gloeomargarita sp. SKYB120]MDW8176962.1 zf-HC2 domain-containing protein [Gloeomargarita sp. SKYBB_i_bin120]